MDLSLSAALETGGIHYSLKAESAEGAARAMVAALPLLPSRDREDVLQMLLAQGSAMLTLLHDGVAIPHVKRPTPSVETGALLALFFLETPLALRTDDGKNVGTLLFLLSHTIKEHLEMLGRIAGALKDQGVKDAVSRRGAREEILREVKRFERGA